MFLQILNGCYKRDFFVIFCVLLPVARTLGTRAEGGGQGDSPLPRILVVWLTLFRPRSRLWQPHYYLPPSGFSDPPNPLGGSPTFTFVPRLDLTSPRLTKARCTIWPHYISIYSRKSLYSSQLYGFYFDFLMTFHCAPTTCGGMNTTLFLCHRAVGRSENAWVPVVLMGIICPLWLK